MWYWPKNRQTDQYDRAQRAQNQTHSHSQVISDKGTQATQRRERQYFQQMVLEQLDVHIQKNKPRHLKSFIKINSE